jgi:hypothetical protein
MLKKKKSPNFAKNKKAFDTVVAHLRTLLGTTIGHVGAVNVSGGGHAAPQDPAKPTPVEFRADVTRIVRKTLPKNVRFAEFLTAYVLYDSEYEIERGKHAEKVLGARMHSVEQRLGSTFIEFGVYPVQAKGYFYHERKERPRGAV